MNQVKSMLNPVCSVIQSNKSLLSTFLVVVVAFAYFPFDELVGSNMQSSLLNNLKVNGGVAMRVVMAVLVLCLYLNGDVMNLALLLWFYKALRL
tara:strand:+ start:132 stop:413 length:282 start_codon:yes stop_codon:yes gene_type:complete